MVRHTVYPYWVYVPRARTKEKARHFEAPGLSSSLKEKEALDGFLQFLGGAERDLLGSLDLDGFAGGRVAAHARTALAHDQDAQAIQTEAGTLLQLLCAVGDEGFQDQ